MHWFGQKGNKREAKDGSPTRKGPRNRLLFYIKEILELISLSRFFRFEVITMPQQVDRWLEGKSKMTVDIDIH